jgi:hypothetical protein
MALRSSERLTGRYDTLDVLDEVILAIGAASTRRFARQLGLRRLRG